MGGRCVCARGRVRVHRTWAQKLVYSDAYICKKCGEKSFTAYRRMSISIHVLFSRHSRCVRCAGEKVYRIAKEDHVDSFSRHPLSVLQGLLFAPTLKCPNCR